MSNKPLHYPQHAHMAGKLLNGNSQLLKPETALPALQAWESLKTCAESVYMCTSCNMVRACVLDTSKAQLHTAQLRPVVAGPETHRSGLSGGC